MNRPGEPMDGVGVEPLKNIFNRNIMITIFYFELELTKEFLFFFHQKYFF